MSLPCDSTDLCQEDDVNGMQSSHSSTPISTMSYSNLFLVLTTSISSLLEIEAKQDFEILSQSETNVSFQRYLSPPFYSLSLACFILLLQPLPAAVSSGPDGVRVTVNGWEMDGQPGAGGEGKHWEKDMVRVLVKTQ
ncbi:unnamed protein product [Arctogadus glacialis]